MYVCELVLENGVLFRMRRVFFKENSQKMGIFVKLGGVFASCPCFSRKYIIRMQRSAPFSRTGLRIGLLLVRFARMSALALCGVSETQ